MTEPTSPDPTSAAPTGPVPDAGDSGGPEVGGGSMLFLRAGLVVVSLIVFGLGAMAVVSLLNGDDAGGDETIADLLATTTTTTATGDGTETPGGDEEFDAFVDEAIAFIEAARERSFLERPDVRLVDVDTMTQIVLDDIDYDIVNDPEAAAASLAFARAIGFFGPDDEFLNVYDVFVSGGVLGVYFPRTEELLVRSSGELTLMTKATVVHELVHAFDDQHFDLEREVAAIDGDLGWTFSAAAEGSASYVEDLWRAELSDDEQAELAAEEFALDPGDIFSLDLGFLIYQTSVYDFGNQWLTRRIETEGIAAIDDALVSPAPTSEMVIEPLDAPGLAPISVDFPEVDGDVVWQGTGGQALVAALLFFNDTELEASNGWGGDAMTVYLDDADRECVRWDLATDSVIDAAELLSGLDVWADDVGATVALIDDLVRVDRCA